MSHLFVLTIDQQENGQSPSTSRSAKCRRLEDLFRPPIDLLFKGSFHAVRSILVSDSNCNVILMQCNTVFNVSSYDCMIQCKYFLWYSVLYCCVVDPWQARDSGTAQNRWLLVNVQNVQEFACQVLNRDVWSNASVREMVKQSFVLWQVRLVCSSTCRLQTPCL